MSSPGAPSRWRGCRRKIHIRVSPTRRGWPRSVRNLDLYDDAEIPAERLKEDALAAEDAALSVKGVTNSGGSGASAGLGGLVLATSHGFVGQYLGIALLALGKRHCRRGNRDGA